MRGEMEDLSPGRIVGKWLAGDVQSRAYSKTWFKETLQCARQTGIEKTGGTVSVGVTTWVYGGSKH